MKSDKERIAIAFMVGSILVFTMMFSQNMRLVGLSISAFCGLSISSGYWIIHIIFQNWR